MVETISYSFVILLAMCLSRTVAQCPTVDPNFPGSCLSLCDDDSECTGGTLCCSNGCGFSCVAPADSNGTSIGARFLKQSKRTTTTTTEKSVPDDSDTTVAVKTVATKSTTTKTPTPAPSPAVGGCTKGIPLRHTDGNILVCGFAAGDFACPPSHTCTFDTARGKFVCCMKDHDGPVSVESQINPCPDGEPLTNAAGGKLSCNAGTTGPCPQGTFCIVGVCCPVVARPFTGQGPVNNGGPDFSQKPGQCPIAQPSPQANCPNECRFDGDCFGPNKCCFTGCGSKCQEAIPFGVDPNLPFNPNTFGNAPVGSNQNERQQPVFPQQRFSAPQSNNGQQTPTSFAGGPNIPDRQFQSTNPTQFNNGQNNFQPTFGAPPPTEQGQGPINRNFPNPDSRQNPQPFVERQGQFLNVDNRPNGFTNGDNRPQGSFQFASNNPQPTLNIPNQPTFNVPPPPSVQSNQQVQSVPPASQIPQSSFSVPVNPGFVPFPNGPFPNQNTPLPFNVPQNDAAIEPRRGRLGSQKSQRLIEGPRNTVLNNICLNVQCPPCSNCVLVNNQPKCEPVCPPCFNCTVNNNLPKCERIANCCPDGTRPLGCERDMCEFARCPSRNNVHCITDSCGICKAAFYDAEGNNVSC